ncbi:MAG: serine/threonine protein kinase [Sandaracinaceae bacterium]|nr:serine/threonine protein kinase [Sandaracinaceae bacterium]
MKICPSCKSDFPGGEIFCPNDGTRLIRTSQYDTVRPDPSGDPLIGVVLGERYRIKRQIGEGGMGLVYEAEHVAIEKPVALKVLRDDFSSRPEVVERFKQEAKSASRIGNDHIVDISDFGMTPSGASYFVMELLEGQDLAEVLEKEGTLDLERAVDIILQCCKALGAAHAKGIVHRDMKPENIFLTKKDDRDDFVKLVDFGIAKMSDIETPGAPGRKLTKTGMIFGTPEYMSPEQAAGKSLDHRVDIYALAVILFEMITGRVPFIGDTFMGILTQHMFEDPPELQDVNPNVRVPEPIVAFLWKGLAKEADHRYASCEEMATALRGAMEGRAIGSATYLGYGESVPSRAPSKPRVVDPESATREVPLPPSSSRGLVLGGVVAMLLIGGTAGAYWFATQQSTQGTDPSAGGATDAGLVIGVPPDGVGDTVDAGQEPVAEPTDAGPRSIDLSVSTTPSGARVWVEGRGEVCASTPCTFDTPAGEEITVRARLGRNEAESVLAPAENTMIQLALSRRPPTGGRRGGPTKAEEGGNTGGGTTGRRRGGGDLKIPDIFRTD